MLQKAPVHVIAHTPSMDTWLSPVDDAGCASQYKVTQSPDPVLSVAVPCVRLQALPFTCRQYTLHAIMTREMVLQKVAACLVGTEQLLQTQTRGISVAHAVC